MKKVYVALFCMVVFALSCSKTNDVGKSGNGGTNRITTARLETVFKKHGKLAVAEVGDSFKVKKGVLVEFKSYDDLDRVLGGALKGYKDSIFLRYNPQLVQRVMDECQEVMDGGAFAPTVYEGESSGWPNYDVSITIPTMNPFVTYGINFKIVPVSGGCGNDIGGNPIPSYESINFNVHFYGIVPSCMDITDINGAPMYICSNHKLATTVSWTANLHLLGATLSVPMSYTHNHTVYPV